MADLATSRPAPPPPCPICGRPSLARFKPFCSVRCADADLGQWLTGAYRVPGPPAEEADSVGQPGHGPAGRLDPEDGLG